MGQSKVSKIERGFLLPSAEDVTSLFRVYGVPADDRAALLALAAGLTCHVVRGQAGWRLQDPRRGGPQIVVSPISSRSRYEPTCSRLRPMSVRLFPMGQLPGVVG